MSVHESLRQYITDNIEDFDTKPDHINISEPISYEKREDGCLEVVGFWEDKTGYSKSRKLYIDESNALYDVVYPRFNTLRSNINISEGNVQHVTIRESTISKQNNIGSIDNTYPFYTKEDSKYNSMAYVKTERDPTERVSTRIQNYVLEELKKVDPDISEEQIVEIELPYSDFSACELNHIRGYVVTEKPHAHYSNVDSLEEYIQSLSKTNSYSYNELKDKDNYLVFYRIDVPDNNVGKTAEDSDSLNQLMKDEMNSIVSVNGEYIFEGEAIVITDYTPYDEHQPKQYGYLTSEHSEYICFYVRQPFNRLNVTE